jgi:hypothetical protein
MQLRKVILAAAVLVLCAVCFAADDAVKIDNDVVRIIKATELPHNKGPLHRHAMNRVMVYLDAGDITINHEDGRVEEQHWKAGDVAWSLADGMHTSENVGVGPIRLVEIELKKPAPATPPVRKPELDPLAIDSAHYTLFFENDQVRVFRSWREPGGAEPLHEHTGAGRATVLLTNLDSKVKLANGSTIDQHGMAGDVTWSDGAVVHTSTNVGANRLEVIVVEVK